MQNAVAQSLMGETQLSLDQKTWPLSDEAPKYAVEDFKHELHLRFDLSGGVSSKLNAFFTEDQKIMYVLADRNYPTATAEYYWQFALPRHADALGIKIEIAGDTYLIRIPKDPGLLHLVPIAVETHWNPARS